MVEETCGGVVVNNGKVLVVLQKNNMWCLPKGHINDNESLEECARREIYEETGINDLEFVKKIGFYFRGSKSGPDVKKKITMLLFKTNETELNPTDAKEAKWLEIDKVADILSYDEDREFFLKIKDDLL